MTYQDRLLQAIPGGAHTYSRGFDQFPSNAPQILSHGKGAYVYDANNTKYLDYGMALRAVHLGYANKTINDAAIKEIKHGNNLTRASMIELEAAELLIDLIDSIDMVKFTKNGSTATTAAIKLSRAYTGKDLVLRCSEHPFFSYDDWFISSTEITKGIPSFDLGKTKQFHYNNIESLKQLFEQYSNQIACVILEPSSTEHPLNNFLHDVQTLCQKHNAVFILDEMITGFRWDLKGAQHYYNIKPDLCTFGKAMANGFSVAAVGGKREIMQLGSTEFEGQERVFLLSTTHGAEMCGLGAFVANIKFMRSHNVIEHLWDYGTKLIHEANSVIDDFKLTPYINFDGIACSPYYVTYDQESKPNLGYRTLFAQEMVKQGVLIPWIAISYAHNHKELQTTLKALKKALPIYKKAVQSKNYGDYLQGHIIKPVFRRFN